MDDFKNSTKTQYMKGGACEGYAKGGKVKGAAKINKVMGEFKRGELHSGSSKGPEVSNRKQAVAIALSEARKAGANVPVKKNRGGLMSEGVSSRPVDKKGRRMTVDEMNTLERILEKSGRAERAGAAGLGAKTSSELAERAGAAGRGAKTSSELAERLSRPVTKAEMDAARAAGLGAKTSSELAERLSRPVTKAEMDAARAARGKGSFRSIPLIGNAVDALGMKKGGLSAMPHGKKR